MKPSQKTSKPAPRRPQRVRKGRKRQVSADIEAPDLTDLDGEALDLEPGAVKGAGLERDAFSRYMKEIGPISDTLSKQEEVDLNRTIRQHTPRAVRALHDKLTRAEKLRKRGKPDSKLKPEERRLLRLREEINPEGLRGSPLMKHLRALANSEAVLTVLAHGPAAGHRAAEQMVHKNLRLVITMAKRYHGNVAFSMADIIQEGNLGLLKGVARFDYRRGFRFSTYACWWIRHAITRAIADKSRAIRVPVHATELISKTARKRQELTDKLARPPSDAELAKAMGTTVGKLHKLVLASVPPRSLDDHVGEDGDPLGDLIAHPSSEEPPPLFKKETFEIMRSAMSVLNEREIEVINLRFGLGDAKEITLRQIGDSFSLSRERIRQLESQALKKMRAAMKRRGIHSPF